MYNIDKCRVLSMHRNQERGVILMQLSPPEYENASHEMVKIWLGALVCPRICSDKLRWRNNSQVGRLAMYYIQHHNHLCLIYTYNFLLIL